MSRVREARRGGPVMALLLLLPPALACSCLLDPPVVMPANGSVVPDRPVFHVFADAWLGPEDPPSVVQLFDRDGQPVPLVAVMLARGVSAVKPSQKLALDTDYQLVVWPPAGTFMPAPTSVRVHTSSATPPPPPPPSLNGGPTELHVGVSPCGSGGTAVFPISTGPSRLVGVWKGKGDDGIDYDSAPAIWALSEEHSLRISWGVCSVGPSPGPGGKIGVRVMDAYGQWSPPLELKVAATPGAPRRGVEAPW